MEVSWRMFEKVKELGIGSFGVVYLVKCTQSSVIRSDGAAILSKLTSSQATS
jgi:serine/threonine protein kinase